MIEADSNRYGFDKTQPAYLRERQRRLAAVLLQRVQVLEVPARRAQGFRLRWRVPRADDRDRGVVVGAILVPAEGNVGAVLRVVVPESSAKTKSSTGESSTEL